MLLGQAKPSSDHGQHAYGRLLLLVSVVMRVLTGSVDVNPEIQLHVFEKKRAPKKKKKNPSPE